MFSFKFLIYVFLFFKVLFLSSCFCTDMVLISGGHYIPLFKYNNIDDKVYVKPFMIDIYPVSNLDFLKFVSCNEEWQVDNVSFIFADKNYLSHWKNNNIDLILDYPVVNISWFAAYAYCSYLEARLPTIDEWEYVASAGEKSVNGKDEPFFIRDVLDWYSSSQITKLISMSFMIKNFWGVFGMYGAGIWEWVSDFNSVILLNTDAEGGGLEEVLYCGATATNAIDPSDYVAFMRFAFRNALEANYTSQNLGFRCVKDVN